jgi:hypothetical protein
MIDLALAEPLRRRRPLTSEGGRQALAATAMRPPPVPHMRRCRQPAEPAPPKADSLDRGSRERGDWEPSPSARLGTLPRDVDIRRRWSRLRGRYQPPGRGRCSGDRAQHGASGRPRPRRARPGAKGAARSVRARPQASPIPRRADSGSPTSGAPSPPGLNRPSAVPSSEPSLTASRNTVC